MKKHTFLIFIETIIVVLFLLFVYYSINYISIKVVKVSQITHLFVHICVQITMILICLLLVCNKNKILNRNFLIKKLRFKKISKRTIYLALGVYLISGVLSGFIKLFLKFMKTPIDINEQFELAKNNHVDENFILMVLSILVISVFGPLGEEILFRGYLLPKQEKILGKFAWILNGFAFSFAHLMTYNIYSILIICPFSFLVAYKVQKHKNTSIGWLAHLFLNTGFIIKLLM